MEQPVSPAKPARKWWMTLLKIAVTVACLWFVSTKIDLAVIGDAVSRVSPGWVMAALGLYTLSKVISSYRLNIYFRNVSIELDERTNLKLYWLGMFYNLFLPGSIGGDAYKLVLLARKFKKSYRQTAAAVLLDRFGGLAGLFFLLSVYGIIVAGWNTWTLLVIAVFLLGTALLFFIIKIWMPVFLPGFLSTFILGIVVQAVQVLAVYSLMAGLGVSLREQGYLFLFLLSSVASVLPISIGGLGLRELVFLHGSLWLALSKETAVMISLLFFLITVITSLPGLWFVFADPLREKKAGLDEAGN